MLITPEPSINPVDILVWPDGFWCFREELSLQFLRDDKYRVILCSSDEWLMLISERNALRTKKDSAYLRIHEFS